MIGSLSNYVFPAMFVEVTQFKAKSLFLASEPHIYLLIKNEIEQDSKSGASYLIQGVKSVIIGRGA